MRGWICRRIEQVRRGLLLAEGLASDPGVLLRRMRWGQRSGGSEHERTLARLTSQLAHGALGYRLWFRKYGTLARDERRLLRHVLVRTSTPRITVVAIADSDRELASSLDSARSGLLPAHEMIAVRCCAQEEVVPARGAVRSVPGLNALVCESRPVALMAALQKITTEFFLVLWDGACLAEHALALTAIELAQNPDGAVVYFDEDLVDGRGVHRSPRFKPDWSPDFFLSADFITGASAFATGLLQALPDDWSPDPFLPHEDLTLRLVEHLDPSAIRHVPAVLVHKRASEIDRSETGLRSVHRKRLIESSFARREVRAQVVADDRLGLLVRYALPDPVPFVSIIIPTRDRLALLRGTIDSLLSKTEYRSYEVIVVDNDSEESETARYLDELQTDPRFKVLRVSGEFNFSRLNNLAVPHAAGGILLFLNNDVLVEEGRWLEEMVRHAVRPEVGAVGARLCYPDGTLQHGGIVLGIRGSAGHAFRRLRRERAGYLSRAVRTCNYSALTAACLVMRRDVFNEVGGFDEEHLPVAYNDVDLCLRVRRAGYWLVWTPAAELVHLESASRGTDRTGQHAIRAARELEWLKERWRIGASEDPFYSPNLTNDREDFSFAFPSRWNLSRWLSNLPA